MQEQKASWRERGMGRLRRWSIHKRLRTAFVCTTIVPILFLGTFCAGSYQRDMKAKLTDMIVQTLQGLNKTLDVSMKKFLDYSYSIITSQEVNELLKRELKQSQEADMGELVESSGMGKYMWSESYDNIILYNNKLKSVSSLQGVEPDGKSLYHVVQSLEQSQKNHGWFYLKNAIGGDAIVFIKRINDRENWEKQIGYLCFLFNEGRLFRKVYEDVKIGDQSEIFVVDSKNRYFSLKNQKEKIGQDITRDLPGFAKEVTAEYGSYEEQYQGRHCLIVYQYNQTLDATLATAVDVSYINQNVVEMIGFTGLLALLLILLCQFIIHMINDSITVPISKLEQYTKQVSEGSYEQEITDDSKDEMGHLTRYSENMVRKLTWYMKTIEEEGNKRRKLEIQNLQYQIQPHFLFNTLNTFKYIAMINNVESLGNGIEALCSLLKNTVSVKDEMIPLKEEIEQIRNYICIQEFRYAGCLKLHYEIQKEAENQMVPRLLLQPLVENSIVHGMREDTILTIWIRGLIEEGHLSLVVEDNGLGFSIETPVPQKQRFSGIGIENIAERIRLIYQGKGSFKMESEMEKGTKVLLTIPCEDMTCTK